MGTTMTSSVTITYTTSISTATRMTTITTTTPYDPCANKTEDETCRLCAPNKPRCMETKELKTCQNGKCESAAVPKESEDKNGSTHISTTNESGASHSHVRRSKQDVTAGMVPSWRSTFSVLLVGASSMG